jgi:hypothetical protein
MNKFSVLTALAIGLGLAGCADVSTPGSSVASAKPASSGDAYAYPSSSVRPFGGNGYHPMPYDNTGNGPGETGMEGGGG